MPTFRRRDRLTHAREYQAAYAARAGRSRGPITVHCAPNGLDRPRLGLAVGRRVGIATRRNRVKRLVREAFRLARDAFPPGFDYVVSVRPHEPLSLVEYQRHLAAAAAAAHQACLRRAPGTPASAPERAHPEPAPSRRDPPSSPPRARA